MATALAEENQLCNKSDQHHLTHLASKLNGFRSSEFLCDLKIVAGEKKFSVHRNVMCGSSQYFFRMLSSELGDAELKVLEIQNVSEKVMEIIINYCYKSTLVYGNNDVLDLLAAADKLQFDFIKSTCVNHLLQIMSFDNIVSVISTAILYSEKRMIERVSAFIQKNFDNNLLHSNLLELSLEHLNVLVPQLSYISRTRYQLPEFLMKWCNHDPTNRETHLMELLKLVYAKETANEIAETANLFCLQRYLNSDNNSIYHYKADTNNWISFGNVENSSDFEACSLGKRIYLCGGIQHGCKRIRTADGYANGVKMTNNMNYYDTGTKLVWQCKPMSIRKSRFGFCAYDGLLYAVGGYSDNGPINQCERYNPARNEWTPINSLKERRHGNGLTVADRSVYCIGGGSSNQAYASDIVQRYDTRIGEWQGIPGAAPDELQIGKVHCFSYGDCIYTLTKHYQKSVLHEFDLRTYKWVEKVKVSEAFGDLEIKHVMGMNRFQNDVLLKFKNRSKENKFIKVMNVFDKNVSSFKYEVFPSCYSDCSYSQFVTTD